MASPNDSLITHALLVAELRNQRTELLMLLDNAEEAFSHVVFRSVDEPAAMVIEGLIEAVREHLKLAALVDVPKPPPTDPVLPADKPCDGCNGRGVYLLTEGPQTTEKVCEACLGVGAHP